MISEIEIDCREFPRNYGTAKGPHQSNTECFPMPQMWTKSLLQNTFAFHIIAGPVKTVCLVHKGPSVHAKGLDTMASSVMDTSS